MFTLDQKISLKIRSPCYDVDRLPSFLLSSPPSLVLSLHCLFFLSPVVDCADPPVSLIIIIRKYFVALSYIET
jgi:hypothetical protein